MLENQMRNSKCRKEKRKLANLQCQMGIKIVKIVIEGNVKFLTNKKHFFSKTTIFLKQKFFNKLWHSEGTSLKTVQVYCTLQFSLFIKFFQTFLQNRSQKGLLWQ